MKRPDFRMVYCMRDICDYLLELERYTDHLENKIEKLNNEVESCNCMVDSRDLNLD